MSLPRPFLGECWFILPPAWWGLRRGGHPGPRSARLPKGTEQLRPLLVGDRDSRTEVRVAVGTSIAARPPHRSVRAALPHTALALDDGVRRTLEQASTKLPFSPRRLAHATPPAAHGFPALWSGPRWTVPCSPRPTGFPPQPPPPVSPAGAGPSCSVASSVLSRCPTPRRRACGSCGFHLHPPVCR